MLIDDDIQFMGTNPAPRLLSDISYRAHRPVTGIVLHVEKSDKRDAFKLIYRRVSTSVVHIGRRPGNEPDDLSDADLKDDEGCAKFRCAVVSRKHAKIMFSDSGFAYLIDLGSHHGTHIRKPTDLISKMIIPETAMTLEDGDIITFGKTVGKGEDLVTPVIARVELLYGGPGAAPPFSTFKPLVVPAISSSNKSGSSSGRYGVRVPSSSSSSDDSYGASDEAYSDIEEIPAPSMKNESSSSNSAKVSVNRAFEKLKGLFPPTHTPLAPARLSTPPHRAFSPEYEPFSPPYSPRSPRWSRDSSRFVSRSSSPDFTRLPTPPLNDGEEVPEAGNYYDAAMYESHGDIFSCSDLREDNSQSQSSTPMDLGTSTSNSPSSSGPASPAEVEPQTPAAVRTSSTNPTTNTPPASIALPTPLPLEEPPAPPPVHEYNSAPDVSALIPAVPTEPEIIGAWPHSHSVTPAVRQLPLLERLSNAVADIQPRIFGGEFPHPPPFPPMPSLGSPWRMHDWVLPASFTMGAPPANSTVAVDVAAMDVEVKSWAKENERKEKEMEEERKKVVEERQREKEERMREKEERLREAEERKKAAEERKREAEERIREAEERKQEEEDRLREEEERKEDIEDLKSDVEKLQDEVEELETKRQKYKARFQMNVQAMESKISDFEERITDIKHLQEKLAIQVDAVTNVDIPDIQLHLEELQDQVGESQGASEREPTPVPPLHEREDVKESIRTLRELVDEMRLLREQTQKQMAVDLDAVRAARDVAMACLAAQSKVCIPPEPPAEHRPTASFDAVQAPVLPSLKRKRDDRDEDGTAEAEARVNESENVNLNVSEKIVSAGEVSTASKSADSDVFMEGVDTVQAIAYVDAVFDCHQPQVIQAQVPIMLDMPSPRKRAKKFATVVAHTATALTVGAVVTWSALAFS
ncbi:hypothetical protein BDQ12DRAFT_683771 [Crucibulum laeve]|uniref:FHA domain-containing protein n=1 Tax=Crucibulum laeve TaxID=68775 RepID=A0A5C3LZ57_9AGAR|nr:hypothetical protein BDQ12DRAFT_683771 [Crucibulum laeve]